MRKTLLILGTAAALAFTAALPGAEETPEDAGSHLGTWRLVSANRRFGSV